ncbi:MAG: M15 family metallopeptidase [Cellulomonas sp.]|nr:M15 family metallopeptidase [Cellulomonas sp.]
MPTITNGALPDTLLVAASGSPDGGRLRSGTASRWDAVRAAVAAAYGWTPAPIAGGTYRPLADQERLFLQRYTPATTGGGPFGDVRSWASVRYVRTSGAPAAIPGTSNHGWGTAIDVDGLSTFTATNYVQLAPIAAAHGFTNTEGWLIGEPWHWVDQADPDNPPAPTMEDDMSWDQPMANGDKNPDGSDVMAPAWTLLHDARVMAGQALAAIAALPESVWAKGVDGGASAEARLAAVQTIAERLAANPTGTTVNVDVNALAIALGPELVRELAATLTKAATA